MSKNHPLKVDPLGRADALPRSVRKILRRSNRRGRTGLIFRCAMRDTFRSVTRKWSLVSIECEGKILCEMSNTSVKRPVFVELSPGRHELTFRVIRAKRSRNTVFHEEVSLREGDVFLALCEPIQPDVFYRKSPTEDTWRIGVVDPVPNGRPARPAGGNG